MKLPLQPLSRLIAYQDRRIDVHTLGPKPAVSPGLPTEPVRVNHRVERHEAVLVLFPVRADGLVGVRRDSHTCAVRIKAVAPGFEGS